MPAVLKTAQPAACSTAQRAAGCSLACDTSRTCCRPCSTRPRQPEVASSLAAVPSRAQPLVPMIQFV